VILFILRVKDYFPSIFGDVLNVLLILVPLVYLRGEKEDHHHFQPIGQEIVLSSLYRGVEICPAWSAIELQKGKGILFVLEYAGGKKSMNCYWHHWSKGLALPPTLRKALFIGKKKGRCVSPGKGRLSLSYPTRSTELGRKGQLVASYA